MDRPISSQAGPTPATPPQPVTPVKHAVPATPPPAPPPVAEPVPAEGLSRDPLVGHSYQLLANGADRDRTLGQLAGRLAETPVDTLKVSYQTARTALTELLHSPGATAEQRGAANEVLTLLLGALRTQGFDAIDLAPSQVRFTRLPEN